MKEIHKLLKQNQILPFFNKCGAVFKDMSFNVEMCLYAFRDLFTIVDSAGFCFLVYFLGGLFFLGLLGLKKILEMDE